MITSGSQTLAGVRDAVNAAEIGVTAAIVNDENGARLVFSSDETGKKHGLKVTISDDGDGNNTNDAGLSQLAYDPLGTAGAGKNISETVAADDATLTINGIAITSAQIH